MFIVFWLTVENSSILLLNIPYFHETIASPNSLSLPLVAKEPEHLSELPLVVPLDFSAIIGHKLLLYINYFLTFDSHRMVKENGLGGYHNSQGLLHAPHITGI